MHKLSSESDCSGITLEFLNGILEAYYKSKFWGKWATSFHSSEIIELQKLYDRVEKTALPARELYQSVLLECILGKVFKNETKQALHLAQCKELVALQKEASPGFTVTLEDYFSDYCRKKIFTKGTLLALKPMIEYVTAQITQRPSVSFVSGSSSHDDEEKVQVTPYDDNASVYSATSTRVGGGGSVASMGSISDGQATEISVNLRALCKSYYNSGWSDVASAGIKKNRDCLFYAIFGNFYPVFETINALPQEEKAEVIKTNLYKDLVLSLVKNGPRATSKDANFSDERIKESFQLAEKWQSIVKQRQLLKETPTTVILPDRAFGSFYAKRYRAKVMGRMIKAQGDGLIQLIPGLEQVLQPFLTMNRPPKHHSSRRKVEKPLGGVGSNGQSRLFENSAVQDGQSALSSPLTEAPSLKKTANLQEIH